VKIVKDKASLRQEVQAVRKEGRTIGFVPTMGALHAGHLSLVKLCRKRTDYSVASIFVNPTQFGPNEDFDRYPRTPEQDCELLEAEGVDLIYLPEKGEMYGDREDITVDPGPKAMVFEGRMRPTHFRGVLTVVAKLFSQVQPDAAVFGEKDAQQLFLVREMVKNLSFPIEIVAGPTLREEDGLALSSRNRYLKKVERERACVLFHALEAGVAAYETGERSLHSIREAMYDVIDGVPEFHADYFTAIDDSSFEEVDPICENLRLIIAGRIGSVRLIDNMRPEKVRNRELSL
jgi:pantoate--beta-alanine ligase